MDLVKISKEVAEKFGVFSYYTEDDVSQEAYIYGFDFVSRYPDMDEEKLRTHIRYRLCGLKRNKYVRKNI